MQLTSGGPDLEDIHCKAAWRRGGSISPASSKSTTAYGGLLVYGLSPRGRREGHGPIPQRAPSPRRPSSRGLGVRRLHLRWLVSVRVDRRATSHQDRRAYTEALTELPDWRITCFFVDRDYRRRGVATAALKGALSEIASLGGGTVESYPEDVKARSVSGSFLHNATLSMFEQQGFLRTRRLGRTNGSSPERCERRRERRHGDCARTR